MPSLSPVDDEHVTTFGLLLETHAALVKTFDNSLRETTSLPLRWFEVLLRLSRTTGSCLPAGELADSISLTSGATTRLIDRLTEAGLVERQGSPTDRRVVAVRLTDEGEQRLAEALPIHLADLRHHLVAVLEPAQLAGLATTLRQLRDQLM